VGCCNLSLLMIQLSHKENTMPTLISVLALLLGLALARSATADSFTDVFVTGSNFTYNDQIAVTQTNSLAGSINGTAPTSNSGGGTFTGSCFSALAGSASCLTQDLNPTGSGSLDSALARASASVSGSPDQLFDIVGPRPNQTSVDASKTTFAAAAAFARAGADLSVAGVLTGDTPVVDLGGIILFGGTDPLGSLFALEITDQTPSLGSKLLNSDIRSLSLLGSSAKSILGTPTGWTETPPSKTFYKLVATLLPDGTFSVSDGGLLGSGHVTAADFFSGCGTVTIPSEGPNTFTPGPCPAGVQTQMTLLSKRFTLPGLSDPQAFTTDLVKLEVAAVPEPSTLLLLGSGLLGLAGWRYKSRVQ